MTRSWKMLVEKLHNWYFSPYFSETIELDGGDKGD